MLSETRPDFWPNAKPIFKRYQKPIFLVGMCAIFAAICATTAIVYQVHLLASLEKKSHTSDAIQEFSWIYLGIFALFQFFYEVLVWLKKLLQNHLQFKITTYLREKCIKEVIHSTHSAPSGAQSLFSHHAPAIALLISEGCVGLFSIFSITFVCTVVLMSQIGWPGGVFLVTLAILVWGAKRGLKRSQSQLEALNTAFQDRVQLQKFSFTQMHSLRLLSVESFFLKKVKQLFNNELQIRTELLHLSTLSITWYAALRYMAWVALLGLLLINSLFLNSTELVSLKIASTVFVSNWFLILLTDYFVAIGSVLTLIKSGAVSLEKFQTWMHDFRQSEYRPSPLDRPVLQGKQPWLQNQLLPLKVGTSMCVTGPTASGKTSLLSALATTPTLVPILGPQGTGLATSSNHWISTPVAAKAFLPQELPHVPWTIAQILSFYPFYDILETGKMMQLLQLVSLEKELENGNLSLQTRMGKKGQLLSAGQWQRLWLARIMGLVYRFPSPVLFLLDDPFSHLDSAVAQEVLSQMKDFLKEHLVLVTLSDTTWVECFESKLYLGDPA